MGPKRLFNVTYVSDLTCPAQIAQRMECDKTRVNRIVTTVEEKKILNFSEVTSSFDELYGHEVSISLQMWRVDAYGVIRFFKKYRLLPT